MKIGIFLATFLLASSISLVYSGSKEKTQDITIDCTLSNVSFIYFNFQPTCTVKSKLNIVSQNTKVIGFDTGCDTSKPNPNVKVFYVLAKVVRYIPYGLEVLFPNLIGFRLESTQLRVVTKENLKPFPNLKMFACVGNQVQFLEEDLFIYNTQLEYVSFRANRISYIHPSVFTVISGTLKQLYMDGQAVACGIGNVVTPGTITNALKKLGTSACTDINNAPALYIMWLELKVQLEQCEDSKETTTVAPPTTTNQPEVTDPVTSEPGTGAPPSDLLDCQGSLDAERAKVVALEADLAGCAA